MPRASTPASKITRFVAGSTTLSVTPSSAGLSAVPNASTDTSARSIPRRMSAVTGVAAVTTQRPVRGERYGCVKTTVPDGAASAGAKYGSSASPAESCHCGDASPSTTRAISRPLWSTNATTPAKPCPILPMRSRVASRRLRPSVVRRAAVPLVEARVGRQEEGDDAGALELLAERLARRVDAALEGEVDAAPVARMVRDGQRHAADEGRDSSQEGTEGERTVTHAPSIGNRFRERKAVRPDSPRCAAAPGCETVAVWPGSGNTRATRERSERTSGRPRRRRRPRRSCSRSSALRAMPR